MGPVDCFNIHEPITDVFDPYYCVAEPPCETQSGLDFERIIMHMHNSSIEKRLELMQAIRKVNRVANETVM